MAKVVRVKKNQEIQKQIKTKNQIEETTTIHETMKQMSIENMSKQSKFFLASGDFVCWPIQLNSFRIRNAFFKCECVW